MESGRPQVENDEAVVLQQAAKAGAQVLVQAGVIVEPPEGRPGEDKEKAPGPPQTLELVDSGGIIRRRAPVFPCTLQEGSDTTARADYVPEFILIHKDKLVFRGDQPIQIRARPV